MLTIAHVEQLSALKIASEKILSHPTWDVVTIVALVGIGFFYGISAGKWRISATIIYTYMTLAIFTAFPVDKWTKAIPGVESFFLKIALFLAVLFTFAFMLGPRRKRSIMFSSSWWQIFVLSFTQAGLLIHIILTFLPPEKIKQLAPITRTIFANPDFHKWWLIGPAIVLIILRRFEGRED